MRVLAFITDPDITRTLLVHLGLSTIAPIAKPARAPPQRELLLGTDSDPCDLPPDHDAFTPEDI
jgi:hypothetical protein